MITMTLTPAERETVINMDDTSKDAIITTHQRSLITKLDKNPAAVVVETLTEGGKVYRMPVRLLSFRTGTRKRVMTDEQRQAASDRMRNARSGKNTTAV